MLEFIESFITLRLGRFGNSLLAARASGHRQASLRSAAGLKLPAIIDGNVAESRLACFYMGNNIPFSVVLAVLAPASFSGNKRAVCGQKTRGLGDVPASAFDDAAQRAAAVMGRRPALCADIGQFGQGPLLLTSVRFGSVGFFDVFFACGKLRFAQEATGATACVAPCAPEGFLLCHGNAHVTRCPIIPARPGQQQPTTNLIRKPSAYFLEAGAGSYSEASLSLRLMAPSL